MYADRAGRRSRPQRRASPSVGLGATANARSGDPSTAPVQHVVAHQRLNDVHPSRRGKIRVVGAAIGLTLLTGVVAWQSSGTGRPIPPTSAPSDPSTACPAGMVAVPSAAYEVTVDGSGTEGDSVRKVVEVPAFCISRTETTTTEFFGCHSHGMCTEFPTAAAGPLFERGGADLTQFSALCNGRRFMDSRKQEFGDHPMNCVNFAVANEFCRKHGWRLPTETEWEVAATAGQAVKYAWGNAAPDPYRLNVLGEDDMSVGISMLGDLALPDPKPMFVGTDGWHSTAPVGSYPRGASKFGVLDLDGNVSEITDSRWISTDEPVVRGTAWTYVSTPRSVVTYRRPMHPDYRTPTVGFRCAK